MKHKNKKDDSVEQDAPAAEQVAQPAAAAEEQTPSAAAPAGATQPAPEQQPPPIPSPLHPAEERLIRMKADFDNLRKRFDRERQDMVTLSNERLIRELLPTLDHFELALTAATAHNTDPAVVEGFKMVYDQMCSALSGFGLKPIDAQGAQFDPNFHEAISQQPSDEVPEHGVILQTRRGYMLGERLLRASQVIVSGGPRQQSEQPAVKE